MSILSAFETACNRSLESSRKKTRYSNCVRMLFETDNGRPQQQVEKGRPLLTLHPLRVLPQLTQLPRLKHPLSGRPSSTINTPMPKERAVGLFHVLRVAIQW